MAKLEQILNEDFEQLLSKIENGILAGNVSASLEDSSDFYVGEPGAVSACLNATVMRAEVKPCFSK